MKQNLLTKHCAMLLLLALATAWSTPAWALTINVKASQEPYVYAWDNGQNPLLDAYPGTKLTNTKNVGGQTWYYIDIDAATANIILSFGSDETKTGDIYVNGNRYFEFANNNANNVTDYYDIPNGVSYQSNPFTCVVNASNWSGDLYAYAWGNGYSGEASSWPGKKMTKVGTNGNGNDVYEWMSDSQTAPAQILFNNNSGSQTSDLTWSNGAYWSNYGNDKRMTISGVILNNTNFPDANLRAAITASTGIAEGGAITINNIKVLDISNHGITNTTGITYFTELEELYANNNDITFIDLQNAINLRILDLHQNENLLGFGTGTPGTSNHIVRLPSGCLHYIDMSNTRLRNYAATAFASKVASTLETFIARDVYYTSDAAKFAFNSVPSVTTLTKLKYLDVSGCDGTPVTIITDLANMKSTLEYLDISNQHMTATGADPALDGFTALQTFKFNSQANWAKALTITNCPVLTHVDVNGNVNMTGLTIDNCPSLQEIIITNSTSLPLLSITNSSLTTLPTITDLTTATALTKIDLTGNAFTAVPTVGGNITTMVLNNNQLEDIVAPSNINYLYAQNNNFGSGAYTLPTTSLVGLDLGKNGFTKFKAENNTSLKSLALAGNTNLTEIELHGNTALTQTSPDGVIESDNGLYIKGLSNLQTLNIENSSFNKFGQQNSLDGLTSLTKLQARHNEFTTFTNGVYELDVAGNANYRIPDPNESSLEHLTALEYLDLAYNNLQDSVHLYKNVALKHLDVSHNNEIHGVIDGTIDPNDAAAVEAMKVKKGYNLMKYGRVYGKDPDNPNAKPMPGWNPSDAEWTAGYTNLHALRDRPFDLRECDLNDTTGLYHLDLGKNVNLEWLDISYTNIHNTAAGPSFMNPGWMDKDWVTDMGTFAGKPSQNTTTHRAYMSWHTFVYIIPCSKLKTLHMDHNNMQSMGVRYFPELDTLTSSYMYGDCALMRDFNKREPVTSYEELRYGYGNTGLSGSVVRYTGDENLTTNSEGIVTNLEGSYPNPTKYVDVSHSGFNSFHVFNGVNLEYLDVSYNPLNYNVPWNDLTKSYNNSLDVTYCPNIKTVIADNSSDLPIVRAHNRAVLETLDLTNDPKLKTVYIQNDPQLNFADAKDDPEATAIGLSGLSSLTGLETLFGYNNTQWGGIDVVNNTALKNLWISNIGTSSINVANNANLEKLRAYDNSLTALDLSNNGELLWLDVARNKLPEIDLRGNSKLQFFNISNGSDTRIQLDGTEDLNHDGSDGDAIKPTTIFSADEAPIANADAGNSLSDLALPASITDARANGNDLHSITGNFANLTNIEFAHNHINGIDLSAAPGATIESRDNGRTIVADCAFFAVTQNHQVIQYKVYFFQLDATVEGNGTVLTLKDSEDLKGDTRRLGTDGMVMDNITWDGTSGSALKNTITPGDMSALDPDYVPGKIVVLNPTSESGNGAEGTATYTYQTGENSTSEFYLNWSSDGTVTGINEIKAEDGVSITNTYGNLTINGKDGTVVGVYDLNGRQVASETIVDGSVTINGLTPGIYVVNGVKVLLK